MGRKPIANPSAATLRKRKQREAKRLGKTIGEALSAVSIGYAGSEMRETARLVQVTEWVPPADVKALRLAAERFRRIARIPESEVPE